MIHPLSDCQAPIPASTNVWQFCVILPNARIGENCNICSHCFIENDVVIGNNATIKCGVQLWDGMRIEDNAFIGSNVAFTNDKYPRSKQAYNQLPIIIKRGASIGAGSVILGGVTIGENSMIGAGSVVTEDVPAGELWYGNPARFVRKVKANSETITGGGVFSHQCNAMEGVGSMICIRRYTPEQVIEWDSFIDSSKNGIFMFKRGFMDYHSNRFNDHSLMFYREDELVAVLPASVHGTELRSHGGLTYGGMICSYAMKQHIMNECFDALIDYTKNQYITSIVYKTIPHILTKYPCEEDLYALWQHNAQLIRRDVSTTIDLSHPLKMPKGRKAQIVRAKREGVKIAVEDCYDEFIALENQVLTEHHNVHAVHTGAELALLHARFPENIKLYIARKDGELIAGSLIFIYDNVVHTQYMASSELGREIGALDLVIATIMNDYKESKQYLDFGISTEQEGLVLNLGLVAQKEGFGGRTNVYDSYKITI